MDSQCSFSTGQASSGTGLTGENHGPSWPGPRDGTVSTPAIRPGAHPCKGPLSLVLYPHLLESYTTDRKGIGVYQFYRGRLVALWESSRHGCSPSARAYRQFILLWAKPKQGGGGEKKSVCTVLQQEQQALIDAVLFRARKSCAEVETCTAHTDA